MRIREEKLESKRRNGWEYEKERRRIREENEKNKRMKGEE